MSYKTKMDTHMSTYKRKDNIFSYGKGTWLFDNNNSKYLDFVSGIAVNSLGHSPDILVDVIKEQAEKLLHISNLYWNEPQLDLCDYLIKKSNHKDVFLCNSGTEAVEAALKLSKKYGKSKSPEKNQIVYFKNSFHGRSMGALSVTGKKAYQEIVTPLIPNTLCITLDDISNIDSYVTDKTCAVIIEPIQGEGGVNTISNSVLKTIKNSCTSNDALLIFDEVQCGIGRTGTFFAYESTEVIPDIICLAKGLGGGIPIGAVLANDKASVFTYGDHGSTFGGNPLSCSVANKVVNTVGEEAFLKEVTDKGEYLISKVQSFKEKYGIIKKIKGRGLLLGVDFTVEANEIISEMFNNKILLVSAGANTVRLLPPLNVSYDEIDYFLNSFEKVISKLNG